MCSLRRLGIHKVCLRRRALISHLLRHFWCFAVLKLRFFVPARTKLQSILSYSQGFGRRRGEKDRFKTVCCLVSAGLKPADFVSAGLAFCAVILAETFGNDLCDFHAGGRRLSEAASDACAVADGEEV